MLPESLNFPETFARVGSRSHLVPPTIMHFENIAHPLIAMCGSVFFPKAVQGDADLPGCEDCHVAYAGYFSKCADEFDRLAAEAHTVLLKAGVFDRG